MQKRHERLRSKAHWNFFEEQAKAQAAGSDMNYQNIRNYEQTFNRVLLNLAAELGRSESLRGRLRRLG